MKQLATTKRRACPKGEGVEGSMCPCWTKFQNDISLNRYWHAFSQQLCHKWLNHSWKKLNGFKERIMISQRNSLDITWVSALCNSSCSVVTYGFQMKSTFELTAVKSNHEVRQYLWTEPDIIFSPSPLLESDIKTVLDFMFLCFRPGHWHTLQPLHALHLICLSYFLSIISNV